MQEALSPNSPLVNLLPFALILGVFYFLLVRPQQQRAKEIEDMQASVRQGDEIVTTGGLHGKVAKVNNDKTLFLEIAPKTQILHYVAFVDRADVRRIISLRRANRREVKRYVQALEEADDPDA